MAKFTAGDMAINRLNNVYMISSIYIEESFFSPNYGKEMYNLDNGVSSFKESAESFDEEFEICK